MVRITKAECLYMVGDIYSESDARRDAGFSIFYMGINLGGFLSPLIVGEVAKYSFHLGFGIAAVECSLDYCFLFLQRKKVLALPELI